MSYYAHYLIAAAAVPPLSLKYLDECHFASKDLRRERGVSEQGRRLIVVSEGSVSESYIVTAVTTLADPLNPVAVLDIRQGSNDSFDFLGAILSMVQRGILVQGDTLVLDNASVHRAEQIADDLEALLTAVGARIMFLPAYSPELNPIEYVFGLVKGHMRRHRCSDPFFLEIVYAFAQVTFEQLVSFYSKAASYL